MRFLLRPIIMLLAAELAGIALAFHAVERLPDGRLHVTFLDIGQGDSAFIRTSSGKQIMIDGGRDSAPLQKLSDRMPLFDRTIDLLILSHPQLDHIAAFPEILRRYRVSQVLMTGVEYDLPLYREFLELLRQERVPVWIADPTKDINLGDGVVIDLIWPQPEFFGKESDGEINDSSIVLRLLYGSDSVLFTGDMEETGEKRVLRTSADVSAKILKIGHHGSKTSSGTGFLLAIGPHEAVISAGRKNSYGHPHQVILDRMKSLGIEVNITTREGDVELVY